MKLTLRLIPFQVQPQGLCSFLSHYTWYIQNDFQYELDSILLVVCVSSNINNNKSELCACFCCCYALYVVGKLAHFAGCTDLSGELWGTVVVSWKIVH